MKQVGVYVLAAAAVLGAGAARAAPEPEPADSAVASPAQPAPKPQASPARPAMFAAASASSAKRMSAEQREERRFLKDAAATSRFETDASRLALARSSDAAVRSFAAGLMSHHASVGPALQNLLHGRGMAPPMLANDQRKTLNRLARLSGAKFDREYMQEVGLKHRQSELQSYEKAGLIAREPALKAWIERTLPALRSQLAAAERIASPQAGFTVVPGVRPATTRAAPPRAQSQLPSTPRGDLAAPLVGAGGAPSGTTRRPPA
jgi:putative membrane protein